MAEIDTSKLTGMYGPHGTIEYYDDGNLVYIQSAPDKETAEFIVKDAYKTYLERAIAKRS